MHPIDKKLLELMEPVEQQIMLCDEQQELVLLALGLMNKSRDILDNTLGESKRRELFKEHS